MHCVKHLFEQVCSMGNLRLAAKEALRGKRSRPPGAAFFMELEKELPALHEELRDGTYTHGGYHYFWIHDPKDRLVAAAPFGDRVVHHAIVRVIEPIFEKRFIEDSYACRRRKGTHAALGGGDRKVALFVDGESDSAYWYTCGDAKFVPLIDGDLGLARLWGPLEVGRNIAVDNIKIFDEPLMDFPPERLTKEDWLPEPGTLLLLAGLLAMAHRVR